jgi:hypothetical protein
VTFDDAQRAYDNEAPEDWEERWELWRQWRREIEEAEGEKL